MQIEMFMLLHRYKFESNSQRAEGEGLQCGDVYAIT